MSDHRDLKREYKNNPPPMGIYRIRNTANGKIYLGASTNLPGALNSSRFQLRMGSFLANRELQDDYRKFGADAFEFTVLETLKPLDDPARNPRDDLNALLGMLMEQLEPYGEKGYHRRG